MWETFTSDWWHCSPSIFIDVVPPFELMHDRWPRGIRRTCILMLSCLSIMPHHFLLSRLAAGSIPAHPYTLNHLNRLASRAHSLVSFGISFSTLLSLTLLFLTLFFIHSLLDSSSICFLSLVPAASCLPFHQYMQLVQSRLAFSRSQSALLLSWLSPSSVLFNELTLIFIFPLQFLGSILFHHSWDCFHIRSESSLSLSASSLSCCLSCLSLPLAHLLNSLTVLTLLTWSFHAYSRFFTHLISLWIILFSLLPSTSWILCLFILNRLL